jgi:hypothetical protein
MIGTAPISASSQGCPSLPTIRRWRSSSSRRRASRPGRPRYRAAARQADRLAGTGVVRARRRRHVPRLVPVHRGEPG